MGEKNFAVNEYVTSDEIKKIRKKLHLTQKEFAQLVGSSKPTIERWEKENAQIRGPIVLLIEMLNHDMDYVVSLKIPPKELPIRMWYMYKNKPCALIDVDEAKKIVRIKIMWIMCNLPCLEVIPNRVLQIMKIFWNQGVCQDREIK